MSKGGLRFLSLSLILACGLAGFGKLGKLASRRERGDSRHPPESRRQTRPAPPSRPAPWDEFQALLSPESRETDIWKIVSRIPPDRIQDAILSVEKLDQQGTYLPRRREILSALYFHWAENDPQAALAGLPPEPKDMTDAMYWRELAKSVLTAWMRMDPEAAFSNARANPNKDFYFMGRDLMVQTWTPENVFQNLDRHPEDHRDLLGWYCASLAVKPEAREAMLQALKEDPGMKNGDWARFLLFRSWGYKDFDAAMAKAEELKSPDLVDLLVKDNARQPFSAPKVFKWAAKNHVAPGGPDWEDGYAQWLIFDGADARAWLVEQAPVWESEGHVAAAASFLAVDYSNALGMTHGPERDSAEKRLGDLLDRWKARDPQAAAKWSDTAPEPVRRFLSREGGNE